jgi:predicted O-methyltransferase YrrM
MKWFLLNAPQRMGRILSNPRYAARMAFREVTWADERFVARITDESPRHVRDFLDEPANTPDFLQHLTSSEAKFRTTKFESADIYAKKVLIQYALVRAARPNLVVETGIANGISSAYVLLGLQKNGNGILHSIEIGDSSYLPADCEPGWIVPRWLQDRWKVHLGDATVLLPKLLHSLGPIDVFIHDSLHTAEQMNFEFQTAYPRLRTGGYLIADDALWNQAFLDFARSQRVRDAQIVRGVGVLQKSAGSVPERQ